MQSRTFHRTSKACFAKRSGRSWTPRQQRPVPQQAHHGTLPEAVLSSRAGDRLRRAQALDRGPQDDEDDVDPVVEESPPNESPAEAPAEVPEERLSTASSQRQPLPQQPHQGTFPASRAASRASHSALPLRSEDRRRRPDCAAARHADTCESLDDALLVRSRSDAVVVCSVCSAGRMASVGEAARRGLRLRIDTRRRRSDLLGDSCPDDDDCDTSPAWRPPCCLPCGVPGPAAAVEPLDDAAPGVPGSGWPANQRGRHRCAFAAETETRSRGCP